MRTQNLISVYQGLDAVNNNSLNIAEQYKYLKVNEIETVKGLCNRLKFAHADYDVFNGYIIGYTIPQISKEFDLLRFGEDLVVNIELKGPLSDDIKIEKILSQMRKNYYYLKFLDKPLRLYTFVEDDGFYEYSTGTDSLEKIDIKSLIAVLREQVIFEEIDIENIFVPSNYLVSPFNKTESFIDKEYFLTNDQESAKNDILQGIEKKKYEFFCISANAGTGKTLLIYDIAHTYIQKKKNVLVIHCGKLNQGHSILSEEYKWNIISIGSITRNTVEDYIMNRDLIVIDEAQRIREWQLKPIIAIALENNTPIIFSYDVEQYLSEGESRDVKKFLNDNHPESKTYYKQLTNKIRTNKEMASFITNLKHIGRSNTYLDYRNVTIEYFEDMREVKKYIQYLSEREWKAITYTISRYSTEPLDRLVSISRTNAHDVIGQEFEKVVFVMDDNFQYNENGVLMCQENYYSTKGMFYQIVTRVVDKMKIIVLKNPKLYEKLLSIKNMGEK